jgi:hypothetical protein
MTITLCLIVINDTGVSIFDATPGSGRGGLSWLLILVVCLCMIYFPLKRIILRMGRK